MTVLTKANDMMGRKADVMVTPLVVENRHDPERASAPGRRTHRGHLVWVHKTCCHVCLLCFTFFTAVMLLLGATLGLIFYNEAHQNQPKYKGYCAIPIDVARELQQQDFMTYSRMPLTWSSDAEESLLQAVEQDTNEPPFNLVERFDIEENIEKISVFNNGHLVEFIHDFNANATGIVDKKRCFVMALDRNVVLSPGVFVFSIENGNDFEVARVRSSLRALLPPAALLGDMGAVFAEKCEDKPTYQLEKGDDSKKPSVIKRKRSVKAPAHEYEFFAGRNIQEISIANMKELEQYENKLPG